MAVALALVSSACAGESANAPLVVEAASETDSGVVPPADRAVVDEQLADVGLQVEWEARLPDGDSVAFVISVPGEEALSAWASARSILPATGRYPVIVGGPVSYGGENDIEFEQTLSAAEYLVDDEMSLTSVLRDAEDIRPTDWFVDRATYLGIADPVLEATTPLPDYQWAKDQFSAGLEVVSNEPLPFVEIALLPTSASWEVPAYLLWGGWNDNPLPSEHVAVLRHWAENYDAHVVAVTGDVIEFTVASPPTDENSAIDLAGEQFVYAPDIVWQGTGDISLLASGLLDAPVWFFWWD